MSAVRTVQKQQAERKHKAQARKEEKRKQQAKKEQARIDQMKLAPTFAEPSFTETTFALAEAGTFVDDEDDFPKPSRRILAFKAMFGLLLIPICVIGAATL
ncbi:MAG: hypothetical protein ACOYMN_25855, partial [Roseimicrobium sp.]